MSASGHEGDGGGRAGSGGLDGGRSDQFGISCESERTSNGFELSREDVERY